MIKKATRFLAFFLSCLLLGSVLGMFGALQTDASADGRRFIFSKLGTYDTTNGSPVEIELSESNTTFVADGVSAMGSDGTTNTLYIALTNHSNARELVIRYKYLENNSPVWGEVKQDISAGAATSSSYVLPAPHFSQGLSELSISFYCDGSPKGSVTLESFFDVSVYEESFENMMTLESCSYDSASNTVLIKGKLSFDAQVLYDGETLALFALDFDEDLYLSNKTPVARIGVSENFSFSVEVEGAEEIYARYVVAAVTKTGERVPLCTPIYPDIPAVTTVPDAGFKGFHTDSLFSVIDSGAEVEIVDVYLDRMLTVQSTSILYAGAHSYYYFDETYVNELDRRVRNLSGAGCAVYLRFLISPDANGLPFVTYTEDAGDIVNKGITVQSEDALLAVHAFTDFLTLRYAEGTNGTISGIIIGRSADRASTYGYVGSMGLSEYTEMYAAVLNLIAGTARVNIPQVHIVVPVSDRMWPDTVTSENLTGDYFSELFLLSLLEAINTRVLTPPHFSVMLESDAIPDRLSEDEAEEKSSYGIDRLSDFLSILEEYGRYYAFLDTSILYSWMPDTALSQEELCAAYALQYIGLALNNRVRSFFVDFSIAESAGNDACAKALRYMATYINTADTATVTASTLKTVGVSSFTEIYPTYSERALITRQIVKLSLTGEKYQSGATAVGSYVLWNFSTTADVPDWYAGDGCSDLSVLNRALTARFSSDVGEGYAEIAYHFSPSKDYSFAPLMRFSLGIDGTSGTPYEVQIRLLGEGITVISSTVLTAGDAQELYLDLSGYAGNLSKLRSVRVLARPLDNSATAYNLRLHSVTLESTLLDSAALAERIAADSNTATGDDTEVKKDYTRPILVTVLVVGASIALAAFLIIRYRHGHGIRVKATHTEEQAKENNI